MLSKLSPRSFLLKALISLCLIQITACSDDTATEKAAVTQPDPAPTAPKSSTATTVASATPSANTGTVKSIQNAGGYSYIEADINGEIFWIAASISSVQPGEEISWSDYAMMKNFTSKAINRTFDQIMFVSQVTPASAMASSNHSGSVLETISAAGYSYIHVDKQGKNIWLAVPTTQIQAGQNISWSGGAAMRNFTSQSLKRTFDEIYFVSAITINQG